MHLIVCILNQGYGRMTTQQLADIPKNVQHLVGIIAVCETEEKARWLVSHLPQEWTHRDLMWWDDKPAVEVVVMETVRA